MAEIIEREPIRSFAQFWPYYLREHSRPMTRALHFIGSSGGLGLLAAAVLRRSWSLAIAAPVCGYGFAWFGHFFIEKNRPATFRHPIWSFAADWRMWRLMATGQLQRELQRLNLAEMNDVPAER